ncbi:MAG: hypothetical protein HQM10_00020 [Candidatus Riflebacteria bacterium]|nr:hypothetical protein [Candidatus Riflebacteria bacterium]
MSNLIKNVRVLLLVAFSLLIFSGNKLLAQELKETFSHEIGALESKTKTWEHTVTLPEEAQKKGLRFISREFEILGDMIVEKEEFKANFYHIKVKLAGNLLNSLKGTINIKLCIGDKPQDYSSYLPSPDLNEDDKDFFAPEFNWISGRGEVAAVSLIERTSGAVLWERVMPNTGVLKIGQGVLKGQDKLRKNTKYLFTIRISGPNGKWTKECRYELTYYTSSCGNYNKRIFGTAKY